MPVQEQTESRDVGIRNTEADGLQDHHVYYFYNHHDYPKHSLPSADHHLNHHNVLLRLNYIHLCCCSIDDLF